MKNLVCFVVLILLGACGSDGGNGDDGGSARQPETAPAGTTSELEKRVVVGSMLSGINLGLNPRMPSPPPMARFERFAADRCPMIRDVFNNYGDGACSNSCASPSVFKRDCSGERITSSCDGQSLTVQYSRHQMTWDMGGLNNEWQGVSVFRMSAAGQARGDGVQNVQFECDMSIRVRMQEEMEELSCGEGFDMNCSINGENLNCPQLLSAANETRSCEQDT